MLNFSSILNIYGFTRNNYEFESRIAGFYHDLHFSLLDSRSIFDVERSTVYRRLENPNTLIFAELVTFDGDIDAAIQFFLRQWIAELQYENPVKEIINLHWSTHYATIQILTISRYNAMTLKFTIR